MIGFLVQGRVRIKSRSRVRDRVRVGVMFNVSIYHRINCRRSKCRSPIVRKLFTSLTKSGACFEMLYRSVEV